METPQFSLSTFLGAETEHGCLRRLLSVPHTPARPGCHAAQDHELVMAGVLFCGQRCLFPTRSPRSCQPHLSRSGQCGVFPGTTEGSQKPCSSKQQRAQDKTSVRIGRDRPGHSQGPGGGSLGTGHSPVSRGGGTRRK